MSETRPAYGTFQLETLNDEEKLRFALSVLSLEQLHRLATLVQSVQKAGFGNVTLVIEAGAPFLLQVTTSEKVEGEKHKSNS